MVLLFKSGNLLSVSITREKGKEICRFIVKNLPIGGHFVCLL